MQLRAGWGGPATGRQDLRGRPHSSAKRPSLMSARAGVLIYRPPDARAVCLKAVAWLYAGPSLSLLSAHTTCPIGLSASVL